VFELAVDVKLSAAPSVATNLFICRIPLCPHICCFAQRDLRRFKQNDMKTALEALEADYILGMHVILRKMGEE